jgi:hypothetical protein
MEDAGPLLAPPAGAPAALIGGGAAPPTYFPGLLPSLGYALLRSVTTTGYQLLEEQQVQQWQYVLEMDAYAGRPTGDVQNIRIVVAPAFLVPATLDPSYGIVGDTTSGVLRNIASRPALFEG